MKRWYDALAAGIVIGVLTISARNILAITTAAPDGPADSSVQNVFSSSSSPFTDDSTVLADGSGKDDKTDSYLGLAFLLLMIGGSLALHFWGQGDNDWDGPPTGNGSGNQGSVGSSPGSSNVDLLPGSNNTGSPGSSNHGTTGGSGSGSSNGSSNSGNGSGSGNGNGNSSGNGTGNGSGNGSDTANGNSTGSNNSNGNGNGNGSGSGNGSSNTGGTGNGSGNNNGNSGSNNGPTDPPFVNPISNGNGNGNNTSSGGQHSGRVPETGTAIMLAMGATAALSKWRRRRKSN